ncbi:uncharacterized protein LOC129918993 isoform X2 [Episyrphus balteatus]|uniref:uncharacterized protein LOC129918993 isoform X2 n=1 Tax=Episyrphus balteatus TaxID=286459 RepID=UPI00248582C8|nr:uncharacterized protein LOC129918993 isoform X2 [Episyrphus balteatus]
MRPTFDRRLWILLFLISLQCLQTTNQQNIIKILKQQYLQSEVPAHQLSNATSATTQNDQDHFVVSNVLDDINKKKINNNKQISLSNTSIKQNSCANCLRAKTSKSKHQHGNHIKHSRLDDQHRKSKNPLPLLLLPFNSLSNTTTYSSSHISMSMSSLSSSSANPSLLKNYNNNKIGKISFVTTTTSGLQNEFLQSYLSQQGPTITTDEIAAQKLSKYNQNQQQQQKQKQRQIKHRRAKRETDNNSLDLLLSSRGGGGSELSSSEEFPIDGINNINKLLSSSNIRKSDIRLNKTNIDLSTSSSSSSTSSLSSSLSSSKSASESSYLATDADADTNNPVPTLLYSLNYLPQESLSSASFEDVRTPSSSKRNSRTPLQMDTANNNYSDSNSRSKLKGFQSFKNKNEPIIIIDDVEEFDSGRGYSSAADRDDISLSNPNGSDEKSEYYSNGKPIAMPLRPIIHPFDEDHDEEMSVVYAEQHTEVRLICEVDLDIVSSSWYKNGLSVHAIERSSRITDYRFIKEVNGALTITNAMLEDDGKWQCEAENVNAYIENARPVKLIILDRPKAPYLLIDSRRLDAGNIFVPVKENSELNLACISEGGNPKPTLTWEVLLSPGVDRHAQKVAAEVLELEEVKKDKTKQPYKINAGAKSEARLPAVYRAHHNAKILCVMEHPTLKMRQNASLLLDVQYTPSFAISRTPGFGYPLREGIEVSLKCDVDSNPASVPRWQKDDGDTPVPQTGDGFLNFTSIRREHSGWYKCTSRHLNYQYSSIGYYLSVRYDSVDVTSEPDDQDVSVAASHNPNKGQLEVQLGGAVTLQCPQGSLGCWSHLDPVTARLRGLGHGLTPATGQFSIKDVIYQDAGTYKCIGHSTKNNKKRLEVLQTVGLLVKGVPTVVARNATPVAYPGSPLHLSVEFCANPPAHAARWLHGDRVFTPGNQYGSTVLAYGVTDLPTPFCKEARLTYVSMHERVPRTFYFIVSTPSGVAEAVFKVNFTIRYRSMTNKMDNDDEELSEPEEIQFPVFGTPDAGAVSNHITQSLIKIIIFCCFLTRIFIVNLF